MKLATLTALSLLLFPAIRSASAQDNSLGQFDGQCDVGSPKISGSSSYDPAAGTYTITGSGKNMWSTNDQFQFLWKKWSGDFIVRARVEFVGQGVEPHRKIGWMARASLDSDAPYADAVEHGVGLTSLQYRLDPGSNTDGVTLAITNADVIQLERRGSDFTFSAAHSGETFIQTNFTDAALPPDIFLGLFVCAHNPDVKETAIFHDVEIIRPARPDFVPYKDFLGAVLHIVNIDSGKQETPFASARPFEAPNWTRDGSALIYNISGSSKERGEMVRYDLATKQETVIDTGFCKRNNNDHVLTFDGNTLAISGQVPGVSGGSSICTVPLTGGIPKRVTTAAPSYAHGWSPDGKFIVFTGGRNGRYDIYKIPAAGGKEIRLTDVGRNDGSEYTPDGKYIYFSSTRSGKMQIWRMNPDGTDPQQITDDEYNNRFPHISPDGKWIVFITFPSDIDPESHPYYKECYIRLIPITGGAPKVLAYIYGGQGSMNVPSWSPDSKKVAFVSNSDLGR